MECRVLFFFVTVAVLPISTTDAISRDTYAVGPSGTKLYLDPQGFEFLGDSEDYAYCVQVLKEPTQYKEKPDHNEMQVYPAGETGQLLTPTLKKLVTLKERKFYTCTLEKAIFVFNAVEEVYETTDAIQKIFFGHNYLSIKSIPFGNGKENAVMGSLKHLAVNVLPDKIMNKGIMNPRRARINRVTFTSYMDWESKAKDFKGRKIFLITAEELKMKPMKPIKTAFIRNILYPNQVHLYYDV